MCVYNLIFKAKKGFFMPACCRSHKGLITKTIKDRDFQHKESEKVSNRE